MGKTFKKILCTLLVVVMCLTSAPLQGFVGMESNTLSLSAGAADAIFNLTKVLVEGTTYKISWQDISNNNLLGYKVYRINKDGSDKHLGSRATSSTNEYIFYDNTSYDDGYGLEYSYRIEAWYKDGSSNSYYTDDGSISYKVGDIIQFGSYPQSKVTDSATITALNNKAPAWDNWTSYGYYSGTGSSGTMKQGDWMRYTDTTYNGNKYRGVKFTQYRPYYTLYNSSSSNTYQDDNGYNTNTVYWFKFESIDWRVLDPSTGLVMCEPIIDSQPYSNTIYSNGGGTYGYFNDASYKNYASDYETSSIRKWLNEDFYNTAFTDSEKKEISTTTLNNDGYYTSNGTTGYEKLDSNETKDKIFLLSYNEVRNSNFGFNSSSSAYDAARFGKGSDYAQSQGLYVYRSSGSTYNDNSYWLLRSPGRYSDGCCSVDFNGDSFDFCHVSYTGSGVRPALRFNQISGIVNPEDTEVPDTILDHEGIKYDYDYSDTYFAGSSFNYNHDLAIASYCLAISAMVKGGTGEDGKYGTEELDAARTFFSAIEFDNCQPYGYNEKPTNDSIACVIGHKNVELKGQKETIIAVGIRGAGYGSEWSGNFRLGNSTEHAGFAIARDKVMQYLKQYIKDFERSFNSNLKFWITGYSRAAATANLVAATLNNDGTLNGADFGFGNKLKEAYSSGDVFAYTFETPLNTKNKEASNVKYSNIYNFINRIDYVPKVAPSAWGYTRYGENLYMPSLETEGARYYKYLDEMKKEYKKITGKTYTEKFDFYELGLLMEGHDLIPDDISLTKVNGYISQSEFLDELIDIVANDVIISADNYVKSYESSVRKLMPIIMGVEKKEATVDFKITLEDIINELSFSDLVTGNAENLIGRILGKKCAEYLASVSGLSYDEIYNCLGIVDELISAGASNLDYVYTLLENAANIKPAHEPSVNFAWLVSIEPDLYDALEDGDWYLKFVYNCPIDIALYDENGELLATIIDDKVVFPDDRYLTVYVDSDGQKCFCLPNNTEYRFEILGTDEGTMTCSVSKYDFTENKTTEILNYYDIPVEDGTELTMTVNEAIDEELTEKVEVTDAEEKIVNYDDHLESEEIETFNVSVTTDTVNGYVSGGGTYYKGEYAQVEAIEVGCNKFMGWYIDNTCISTELKYRHPVTESVVIEARFLEKHTMGEWYEILPATCETSGTEQRDCSECDYSETQETPALGHDFDGSECKNCNYDKSDDCSCNCHAGGIKGFFFKLILFFQKIFKSNKVCKCGINHY
jgi:hypothetical protein